MGDDVEITSSEYYKANEYTRTYTSLGAVNLTLVRKSTADCYSN